MRGRRGLAEVIEFAAGSGAGSWPHVGSGPRDLVPRRQPRRERTPSVITLLLAGLAVFALARLSTLSGSRRATAEKVLIAFLILVAGAIVVAFRRSARRRRYGW